MAARTLISVVFVCVTLAGCSAMEPRGGPGSSISPPPGATVKHCSTTPAPCGVMVSIDAGKPKPEFEYVKVAVGARPVMTWTLTEATYAAGYRFDATRGIAFPPRAANVFVGCQVHAMGRLFFCTNTHPTSDDYKYDINLTGPNGPVTVDPYVIND
jgi:hypothetical protein